MQTQKDHVHAYQFLMQRMTTALTVGDPSNMEPPTRRGRAGLITGAFVAVLIVIGFGVYGLIVPGGSTAWKKKGAILVEKESGTRYVFLDNMLVSTPNLASAMLIQGNGNRVEVISRKSLEGLARGPRMGIQGAPDTVPAAKEILPPSWLLCPTTPAEGGRPGLVVNFVPDERNEPLPDDRYAPVQSADGKLFLIWRGIKYQVPDDKALVVFGLTATRAPRVPAAWLDLVPDGPALTPAPVPKAGGPGLTVAGEKRRIGDLFTHDPGNGTEQRYVLLDRGLAPLSATEFELMKAQPGRTPVKIDAQSVLTAPFSPDQSMLTRLPDVAGKKPLDGTTGHPCLRQEGRGNEVVSRVVTVPGADRWSAGVRIPPSRGLLVAKMPIPEGRKTPERHLITDRGKRYLVPDDDSIQALGLGGVQPVPMPTEVLSTIPAGPVLTRSAVVVEQGG
ncbi:type VII secretion protein EccB [Lentzea jiangxiensis]|uniref:Type VII secretion protein EccB n=1 Tax=Lentzea jiangxiensis TaxID=641025 RepID=A0A1H0SK88_9PSEU|nr:type VII secretion protein EccB [Lentzea jiangxiensis]SDP42085.1 type VII secretion protein EccB [Lentzea jiangxiensis]